MTYSSALYASPNATLEAAQETKLRRIVELLELGSGSRVLEIGCGWGALAARIAREGAHVTPHPLHEQLARAQALMDEQGLATNRPAAAGLSRRHRPVRPHRLHRDAGGGGRAILAGLFPDPEEPAGARRHAVLQVITIDEPRFEGYRRSPDFIQHYRLSGGCCPPRPSWPSRRNRRDWNWCLTRMLRRQLCADPGRMEPPLPGRLAAGWRPWASTPPSGVSGNITCPIARRLPHRRHRRGPLQLRA